MIEVTVDRHHIMVPRIVPQYKLEDYVYCKDPDIQGIIIGYELLICYNLEKTETSRLQYNVIDTKGTTHTVHEFDIICKKEYVNYPSCAVLELLNTL